MNRTALFVMGMLALRTAAAATVGAATAAVPAARADTPDQLRAYARLPVCTLGADGKSLAVEPCRTAPPRQPMPRRPVPQIMDSAPAPETPRTATAPVATLPAPGAKGAAAPGAPLGAPLPGYTLPRGAPLPTAGCDATGCLGADGRRYNGAGSGTVIGPGGRVCSRNGAVVQC
ncbi:hypothetical protein ACLB1G_22365 [Oxalobacteraceae bacterium A2-2]